MPGIEDLTNIMVEGGRNDIPGGPPPPPMGGPPMGGPPMGGPPMGGPAPLPTGDPAAAETLMANADMLQGDMQRPPMEGAGGGGIEQDAMALADAVVGRAQGDINAALAILDGATQILITSGEQEQPMMAASGGLLGWTDVGVQSGPGGGRRPTPTNKKDWFNNPNTRPPQIAEIQEGLRQVRPGMAFGGSLMTKAGQSELDTRMKKIRDYEDYDQDNSVMSQGGKFDEIVNRIRDFQRS